MNKNDILTLSIDSNTFSALKEDFNKVLNRTLGNMQSKESDEATLTLKLNIKTMEIEVPDFESSRSGATRKAYKPRFDHKISSVMQIKTEEAGSLKGEYELVWDEDQQEFVMRPIDNGQQTIFDDAITADYVTVDDEPATSAKALPSGTPVLEAPEEDGYGYDEPEAM